MKPMIRVSVYSLLLISLMMACTLGAQPAANSDAVNTAIAATQQSQGVVNTAVAGTQQSQILAQTTVNASALTSMPATSTPGPTVEYVTMTEEELTALIDKSVAEAVDATSKTSDAATTATSDGTVTSEEVANVYNYYYAADQSVSNTEQQVSGYYNQYADLANEMLSELKAIESELHQMNDSLTQISTSLNEISNTLSQGLELAQSTVDQLNSAAQMAQTSATELKKQTQDLMAVLQTDQQNRINQIENIQANNIPTDPISALQSGFAFIDTANIALGDNKLSRAEMLSLAQLGKNAQAGFQQFGGGVPGGPNLSQFSGNFSEIIGQFARGQMPQARANLSGFELSLGSRPSGGGLPGGGLPNPPGGPGSP